MNLHKYSARSFRLLEPRSFTTHGRSAQSTFKHGFRHFSSTTPPIRPKSKSTINFSKVILGVSLVGAIGYASSEDIRHNFRHFILMGKRVGVVAVATTRCFNLYRKTLGSEYENAQVRSQALSDTHLKAAQITLAALEKNGGIYIKLGQHISALTYLLPKEWTDTMIPLQDQCPESSVEDIKDLFIRDMGVELDEIFSFFNPKPVGVASLAQVHIATLRNTGEKVAVKIQHPSLKEFVPLDIFLTQTVFSLMEKIFPEYPLTWLGDELQNSIYVELDFTNEAQNAERTSQYFQQFQKETSLRVPQIVSAKPRILIMEYVAGARLDDLEYLKTHNISTSEVSFCLSHIFNNMIFTPGVGLHCDPHGGNLAIRAVPGNHSPHNFEIVLYDHGLYRQIPLQMKRDYSHFWLAVLDNNIPEMRHYAEKITGIKDEQKFKIFMSAITGRDPETAMNYDIDSVRTTEEINKIQNQLNGGTVLEDLMEMLSSMPRIILLILKTNDLTRNLDECLNNPLGPKRTFLIMANYCAKVVYDERKDTICQTLNRWSLDYIYQSFNNWWNYQKRTSQLYLYDAIMIINSFRQNYLF